MNTDEIKQALLAEKELLSKELGEVAVADSENPGGFVGKEPDMNDENPADILEQGHEQEEFSKNQAITNDLEMRMVHVNQALEAIENGTYGTCHACKQEINPDRLVANKAATTCIEHAE